METLEQKHNLPDFKLFKTDETEYWEDSIRSKVKSIESVYLYDDNRVTHLCEFTPSFECYWLYYSVDFIDGLTDEEKDEIWDEVDKYPPENYVDYFHCDNIVNPFSCKHKYYTWEDYYNWCYIDKCEYEDEGNYLTWYNEELEEHLEYFRGNHLL